MSNFNGLREAKVPSPSSLRPAITTPAESARARVAHFPAGGSLPHWTGGSASALRVSRPARCSLALRPACSQEPPKAALTLKSFKPCRYLHSPLRLLPAGATIAGRDSHPLPEAVPHAMFYGGGRQTAPGFVIRGTGPRTGLDTGLVKGHLSRARRSSRGASQMGGERWI